MHHEQALKILLRYIRFIIDYDIVYDERLDNNESYNSSVKLKAFLNFDYVVDKFNRKSILEYIYIMIEESIS